MPFPGYDAWLERPYQEACAEGEDWERAEEEAAERGDGTTAEDILAEWEEADLDRQIEAAEDRAEARAEAYDL